MKGYELNFSSYSLVIIFRIIRQQIKVDDDVNLITGEDDIVHKWYWFKKKKKQYRVIMALEYIIMIAYYND